MFKINTPAVEIIDLYVAPAKRTSSMFTSSRLDQYYSGKYAYRRKGLNARVFKSRQQFRELMCTDRKKILAPGADRGVGHDAATAVAQQRGVDHDRG